MVVADFSSGAFGHKEMRSFGLQVLHGRWFTVLASMLILSMSGATYMFGLYSTVVKTSLGYDQTTLNLLSFFKDLGGNVGIIAGLVNEVTAPWVVLLIGSVMNLFGYFMIDPAHPAERHYCFPKHRRKPDIEEVARIEQSRYDYITTVRKNFLRLRN